MKIRTGFGLMGLMGVIILFCSLAIPSTSATDYPFEVVYDVFPHGGDSSEEILIFIRAFHPNSNEPMWVYVFWDSRVIVQRQGDVIVSDIHQNRWDITFHPPSGFVTKGSHTIKIWIEDSSSNIVKWPVYSYNIQNVVPQPEWFDDLSSTAIDAITGPRGTTGPQGATGASGSQGIPGPTGPKGDIGSTGPPGNTGQQGTTGPEGTPGEPGTPGVDGVDGVDGKNASVLLLYLALGLSGVSTICVILLFGRRK